MTHPIKPLPALVIAVVLSPAVFCQSASSQTVPVPQNILYRAFFHQVSVWAKLANKEIAQGISSGPAAQHYQNAAGLTPAEDTALKSIGSDCEAALANIEGQISQLAAPFGKNPLPATVQQQAAALLSQRANTIASHVQQLQSAFASDRFQLLDAYVRNTMHFNVSTVAPGH